MADSDDGTATATPGTGSAGRLPDGARAIVDRYLRIADRHLPGCVAGFYVIGSTALGGYRHGRSDLDFVAVVDGDLPADAARRIRRTQVESGVHSAVRSLPRGRYMIPGNPNGTYVRAEDLGRPVGDIVPVATHNGTTFTVAGGYDPNPVCWATLARHGIAVRGPEPDTLGLHLDDDELRAWNLRNLDEYWAPWADGALARPRMGLLARWAVSWGALGAPRLHRTITVGDIVTKERAGNHAIDAFDARWHPLLRTALAYRTGGATVRDRVAGALGGVAGDEVEQVRETGRFVREVVRSAHAAAAAPATPAGQAAAVSPGDA